METRRLQYFVQIVDAGSINRAAAVIGIAQPALSQQLAILENELKVRLLNRSTSGITPTEAGRRLYGRAQAILRQVGSLKLELGEAAEAIAGVVALGLPPSLGASIGNVLLGQVLAEFPRVRLQIIEDGASGLALRLGSGQLDLAVSPVRISDPDLEGEELFNEELFLVSAPQLAPTHTDLAQLAVLPWIVTGSPNAIRGQLGVLFTQADLEPNIVAEINSLPMVIRAVQQGLGVTLLPKAAIGDSLAAGSLVVSSIGQSPPQRTIHLYRKRDNSTTPAERIVHRLICEIGAALQAVAGLQDGVIGPRGADC
ncbi:MAG: HTH-type transcriptional regulator CatM [Pseudomonadota bacterium]|jgi:DNA-binding transcriptional LysR family regulator